MCSRNPLTLSQGFRQVNPDSESPPRPAATSPPPSRINRFLVLHCHYCLSQIILYLFSVEPARQPSRQCATCMVNSWWWIRGLPMRKTIFHPSPPCWSPPWNPRTLPGLSKRPHQPLALTALTSGTVLSPCSGELAFFCWKV